MAKSIPTQEKRVLDFIEQNGSITLLQAIKSIGVLSLSSRISSLRKQGYPIVSEMVEVKNKYEETCRVKRYYFDTENKEERTSEHL